MTVTNWTCLGVWHQSWDAPELVVQAQMMKGSPEWQTKIISSLDSDGTQEGNLENMLTSRPRRIFRQENRWSVTLETPEGFLRDPDMEANIWHQTICLQESFRESSEQGPEQVSRTWIQKLQKKDMT